MFRVQGLGWLLQSSFTVVRIQQFLRADDPYQIRLFERVVFRVSLGFGPGFRVWAGLVGKSAWYQQKYKLFLGCWLDPLKYSWWARSHMNSARDTCPVTISESSFDVYFPVHCDLKLDQMLYHKLHTPCLHNPRNFQMALGVGRLPTCNPSWTAPVQLCL